MPAQPSTITAFRRDRRRSPAWRAPLAAALVLAALPAAHAQSQVAGEILVKLRSTAALDRLLAKYPLSVVERSGARPIYRLKVPATRSTSEMMAVMSLDPDVLMAEPNLLLEAPEANKNGAWAIGTPIQYAAQWAPAALRLPLAHLRSTGAGIRVAVLDTGVDVQHPALAGRLLPGADFVDGDTDPSEEGSPLDPAFGHGTHVAGLIALVAPGARILPLRVLDPRGRGSAWAVTQAALRAADPDGNPYTADGVHVINISLGSRERTRIVDVIAKLASCTAFVDPLDASEDVSDRGYDSDRARCTVSGGPVVVAAAGNDGTDDVRQYPAAEGEDALLAVSASSAAGRLAAFSNFGSWVSVAAPGEGVTSTVPGGGYGTWSGTSMAAPLVAGTAALLRAAAPSLPPRDVVRRILETSVRLCGGDMRQVDAAAAVSAAQQAYLSCR